MLGAVIRFHKGLLGMPLPWRLWVGLLVLANGVGPFFFWSHVEARIVLAVFVAGALLMLLLTALSGFTRLLGLGHILWFPLLFFLGTRLGGIPADTAFGLWIRALMAINAASLVLDVADVVRYLAGDREETVKGLGS
jgi:hypothetical protein